jgi:hypothetical protein
MWRPWYSYLVGIVTIGIVTPITSEWECMGAPTQPMPMAPQPMMPPPPPGQ